ncbi:MAG: histidine phosphatase family protein [Cyclobacteriaceae bacterium]
MKTLFVIRHAKSSWKFDLPDQDRPLNLRGRRDVLRVAAHLSNNEDTPDLMITSPASRALYTALFIGDEWGYPEDSIIIDHSLYHASGEDLLDIISKQEGADSLAIFGHNPGLTQLINLYSSEYIDNLPTCGVYAVRLEIDNWSDIRSAAYERKFYVTPKRLPSN